MHRDPCVTTAALRALLAPYLPLARQTDKPDPFALECDGMTSVLATVLYCADVPATAFVGTLHYCGSRAAQLTRLPHHWIGVETAEGLVRVDALAGYWLLAAWGDPTPVDPLIQPYTGGPPLLYTLDQSRPVAPLPSLIWGVLAVGMPYPEMKGTPA